MSSKDQILKAVRAHAKSDAPLPELRSDWVQYPDRLAQFKSLVESVGGRCVLVNSVDEIPALLAGNEQFAAAKKIVSTVAGVTSTVNLDEIDDPHDLASIDWAILPAQFGVAENGAVWVTDEHIRHRALYFIVQHLALIIPAAELVHNMHEAYDRLAVGTSSVGIFVSGPSKTADIEQSLVIGAHGPRSLTLFLVATPLQPV